MMKLPMQAITRVPWW